MARQARLVSEICLEPYGASELFIADVNSDGRPELLWAQTKGIFHSKIYTEHLGLFPYLREEDHDLWCLTATDTSGKMLWQHGTPHKGEKPYCCHTGEGLATVGDVDHDGHVEVVCLAGEDRIVILDGATGSEKRTGKMPADNFSVVRIAKIEDGRSVILAQASEQAYPPHDYGNPLLFLSPVLEVLEEMEVIGSGHSPVVFDADGDGLDEFILGYSLIDHDFEMYWTLDWWGHHDYDPVNMHVDCVDIYRPESSGWFAAIAGSDAIYLVTHDGRMLWRKEKPHPQHCLFGNFTEIGTEPQIFLLNQRYEMNLFALDGEELWSGLLPENWPLGIPKAVENKRRFHMGLPASLWRSPLGTGQDLLVYNEAGWPYAVNGFGEIEVEFPCPESSRQDIDFEVPSHRADDYGFGYRAAVYDLDCDGRQEVIIHDRRRAWIYKLD